MTTQPEALRLAQELDAYHTASHHKEAAAELRRLVAQRDALLSLLRRIRGWDMLDVAADGPHWKREIDAAIAAVEGEKT